MAPAKNKLKHSAVAVPSKSSGTTHPAMQPPQTSRSVNEPRSQHVLRDHIVIGILFAVAFAVLLVALYVKSWKPRRKSAGLPVPLLDCRSADCLRYEHLLRTTLNTSIDPCEDFKAFVTSSWLPGHSTVARLRWALKWNLKYQWLRAIVEQMQRHLFTNPAMGRVDDSFEACRNHSAEDVEVTRSLFKHFLRNLSTPWPEVPTNTVDELDLLINLCVNWNIPLWFSAKMLPHTTGRKILQIGPSAYTSFWIKLYMDMDSADVRRHVEKYLAHFSSEGPKVDYFLVFNMTRAIISELAALCTRESEELTLQDFARRFGVSTDHCISVMNKYFKPDASFLPTDAVVLLVLANDVNLRFPPSVRQSVDLVLNNVREEAATFFDSTTSNESKRIAGMLRDIKVNLWPRQEYLSKNVLARIYGNDRAHYHSALEHWIAERKANGELVGSDAYFESTRLAHSFADEPFAYDQVLNSATLSMVTVNEPLYYNNINKAANYGGLGAAFLKTVLRGIGDGQNTFHGNTSNTHEDMPDAGISASTCPSLPNVGRTSIQLALRAFKATNETDSLSNSLGYATEAFFFITYCHAQSRLEPSFDCNEELRGLDSFLTAFRCPRSSRMYF
ncbi:hypothetical protein MTO96_048685 [Rhipicephalus appendiculatus]